MTGAGVRTKTVTIQLYEIELLNTTDRFSINLSK